MKDETKYLIAQCIVSMLDTLGIIMLIVVAQLMNRPGVFIIAGISGSFIFLGLSGVATKHLAYIRWNLWLFCIAVAGLLALSCFYFLEEQSGQAIVLLVGSCVAGIGVAGCHYLYKMTPTILKLQNKVADQAGSRNPVQASSPIEITIHRIHSSESRQRTSPTKSEF
jgi:hypothetical protein